MQNQGNAVSTALGTVPVTLNGGTLRSITEVRALVLR